jgi:osmoprotectant transport system substrate-binding protein
MFRLKKRGLVTAGVLVAAASLMLAGCSSSNSLGGSAAGGSAKTIIVGAAGFQENVTLAQIYGQALAAGGYKVTYKNVGQRTAYYPALAKKTPEFNLIAEYSGSILDYIDKSATANSPADVDAALAKALPSRLVAANAATAADSDTITVTQDFATKNSLVSIGDLAKLKSFTLAASQQFQTRPDGIKGLQSVYGLNNIKFKAINDGGAGDTLKALLANSVQAADIYSSTPSIVENKLVSLEDPKSLFASQQVVPIVTKSKASSKLLAILNKVSAKLTTPELLKLNEQVQGASKTDPAAAAKAWLTANGLI